jgi:hypothetical protein
MTHYEREKDNMAHIDTATTTGGKTYPEWYVVGSQIGTLVNKVAGRNDLVGLASPESGSGAPACYKPRIAEVEVNTIAAFGEYVLPEMIGDINESETQYEFPKATGAVIHEAFHAKYSRWDLTQAQLALQEDEYKALALLEESRIEKFGIEADESHLVFLRACVMEIVLGDVTSAGNEDNSIEQLAQIVGLVHARVLGGVLDIDEVSEVITAVNTNLGEDVVLKLSAIIRKFLMHNEHDNLEPVYPLAIEWAKIVRELKEERGEDTASQQEAMKSIIKALAEAGEEVEIKNYGRLADQEMQEEWDEEVSRRSSESKEKKEHEEEASECFGKGTGPHPESSTSSRRIETRKPTMQERSAAVTIAQMLEKAKYRERDEIEISSVLPPGRLRTRALVQGSAMRSRGMTTPTEAWRRTVRKHTEDPTLSVGVMVDISGSMGDAMQPMATTAWVMSEATKRVQGKCAMVYYGNDVFATLKAGQHLTDVDVYSAPDGTEQFDKAFKALDGSLNLLYGTGARLLVVVSDGCYTGKEVKAARRWIERCEQAGVAVLWLPFDGRHNGYHAKNLLDGSSVTPLTGVSDPVEASKTIGQACAKALTAVGKR